MSPVFPKSTTMSLALKPPNNTIIELPLHIMAMSVFISTTAIIFDVTCPSASTITIHISVHLNSHHYLQMSPVPEPPNNNRATVAYMAKAMLIQPSPKWTLPRKSPLSPNRCLHLLHFSRYCKKQIYLFGTYGGSWSQRTSLSQTFAFIHIIHFVVSQIYTSQREFQITTILAGPHVRFRRSLTPAQLPSPVLVDRSSALACSSRDTKALSDDELSELSSLSPSPSPHPSRAPSPVTTPRHNPQTASSTYFTAREPVSKTRIDRPTGASRAPFSEVINWDDHLIKSIKVRQ